MRRRKFIGLLGVAATAPLFARAQQTEPVIGFLHPTSPTAFARYDVEFRRGLGELLIVLALLLSASVVRSDAGAEPTDQELQLWIHDAAQNSRCVGLAVGVKSGQTVATGFFGTTGNNGMPTEDT